MAGNTIGQLFRVTTFGESHGLALGCIVDGVPPGIPLTEADLQHDLDRRRPGTSRYTTQRREPDQVKILSGVFEGVTTGTSIGLLIENTDQRSQDYSAIKDVFRPGHADYTYEQKYGLRDYRGGGVKGVEIGDGFDVVALRGSQNRDEITKDGFQSNHAGGILGGISSGQQIIAHMALKPTSSITVPGRTINRFGEEVEMITKGRHDPCVGIRAVPIAEAMLAIVLMDHLLRQRAQNADVKTDIPRW